jgi:transposase
MSTSLIYHAFGAKTYDYVKTEYREGCIHFHLRKKPHQRRCVVCGSREVTLGGVESYSIRSLPIGGKPVFLVLELHILSCMECGALRQESRDVAEARKSYTRAFARYVIELSKQMTLLAIARHLGVGWDLVKEIIKLHLSKRAKRRSWRKVRYIAIDEFAVRKGHRYMTVVLNLDTGEVLYSAVGKDSKALKRFFARLRRARAKLKAIAVDMSEAYASAIKEYWPHKVAIVHDHYHVVANMNAVVDSVRRDEQNRLEGEGKKLIKGSRYLLLRAKEKLAQLPDKQARLDALLAVNETLHKVYLLKEDLRLFWSQESKSEARDFIETWLSQAKAMDNSHLTRFANTVASHIDTILAWYEHPITSGPLEGLNNKIKVMKRSAYGYRDFEFFGLRLLFIHETRLQLTAA